MRTIVTICLLVLATFAYASPYKCDFEGGKITLDSINKKFTMNDEIYDIDGMARGKDNFLGTYTKPLMLNNLNVRYMWAVNKEGKTYFVIVNADNFRTIKITPAQ